MFQSASTIRPLAFLSRYRRQVFLTLQYLTHLSRGFECYWDIDALWSRPEGWTINIVGLQRPGYQYSTDWAIGPSLTGAESTIKFHPVSFDSQAVVAARCGTSKSVATAIDITASRGLANSPWPKFQGDSQNTGQGVGTGTIGIQAWSVGIYGAVLTSPALGQGEGAICTTSNGLLADLDSSGMPKWAVYWEQKYLTTVDTPLA